MPREDGVRIIYYAEDEPGIRTTKTNILKSAGYEVHTFPNGQDLWDALIQVDQSHGTLPDLIITDHEMPMMSGLDLLQKLQSASSRLSQIPRLMVSGDTVAEQAIRHGAIFLPKPVRLKELRETVAHVLE